MVDARPSPPRDLKFASPLSPALCSPLPCRLCNISGKCEPRVIEARYYGESVMLAICKNLKVRDVICMACSDWLKDASLQPRLFKSFSAIFGYRSKQSVITQLRTYVLL